MSTFHPAASLLANFNNTISTISMTRLFIYMYISCSHKTRTKVCYGITAHTLWRFRGQHQVNMESFLGSFTCRICCHVHVLPKEALQFWECGQFLPFIIKRIYPCSFGNKHMHLLTRVYGTIQACHAFYT